MRFPFAQNTERPTKTPVATVSQTARSWMSSARSTGKRPIEVARLGTGPHHVLILGSMYGNEPESIALMDDVLQLARDNPPPPHLTLLLMRTPNPDGLAEHMRTNASGVELNRNLPSTQFTSAPNRLTGPHAGSEAESKYLLRVLKEYQPVRVVHVRSSIGARPLVYVNGQWETSSAPQSLPDDVVVSPFVGDHKAGSIEEFVSVRMDAPLATVHLPPKGFPQLSAFDLLRFATVGTDRKSTPDLAEERPKNSIRPTKDLPGQSGQSRDGELGQVDFLPPPPEFAPTSTASRGFEDDMGFHALPPPPRE